VTIIPKISWPDLAIEKFENKDFEAFFYICGNSLGISVAIGDI
jgi:hypothetical protein